MITYLHKTLLSISFAVIASQATAMFVQPDTLDPNVPGVGTNRYGYSLDDPINRIDPNGHDSFGAGNPYTGYNYEGHGTFVGGYEYDYNSGVTVHLEDNDGMGSGGGGGDYIIAHNGQSQSEKIAGTAAALGGAYLPKYGVGQTLNGYLDSWPPETNKCNAFVSDVLFLAGVPVPNVSNGVEVFSWGVGYGHVPTAGDWATSQFNGFTHLGDNGPYRPGDIVAARGHYTDATGHTAIVVRVDENGSIVTTAYAGNHYSQMGIFGSKEFRMTDHSLETYFSWGGARYGQ